MTNPTKSGVLKDEAVLCTGVPFVVPPKWMSCSRKSRSDFFQTRIRTLLLLPETNVAKSMFGSRWSFPFWFSGETFAVSWDGRVFQTSNPPIFSAKNFPQNLGPRLVPHGRLVWLRRIKPWCSMAFVVEWPWKPMASYARAATWSLRPCWVPNASALRRWPWMDGWDMDGWCGWNVELWRCLLLGWNVFPM